MKATTWLSLGSISNMRSLKLHRSLIPIPRRDCCIAIHELRGHVCVAVVTYKKPQVKIWMLKDNNNWIEMLSVCTKNYRESCLGSPQLPKVISIVDDKILFEYHNYGNYSSRLCSHDFEYDTCTPILNEVVPCLSSYSKSFNSTRKLIRGMESAAENF